MAKKEPRWKKKIERNVMHVKSNKANKANKIKEKKKKTVKTPLNPPSICNTSLFTSFDSISL